MHRATALTRPSFNPRSREGSDVTIDEMYLAKFEFQSTLPRRERPPNTFCMVSSRCFNPRSREGSDEGLVESANETARFNPRSREGSDCSSSPATCGLRCFNPRSREGSDRRTSLFVRFLFRDFNPRSREGSDPDVPEYPLSSCHFNPRPREGSDNTRIPYKVVYKTFQSTLP